jgi:superfamily II DNA or RNA helicase
MARELRDYQLEAVDAIYGRWQAGEKRTAIVMATGLGKTDVIARHAVDEAQAGGRALILAHRMELLDQITARCRMHAPDIAVGRIAGSTDQRGYPITVAMTPTLARESRRKRLEACRPTKVIMDECHHASSPSAMDILRWAGSYEDVRTMGVTATLVRGDRRHLGQVWESVAFERDIKWAIGEGWLVPVRGRVVVADHLNLKKVKTSKGDYQSDELGSMVVQDVDQIVTAWEAHAPDRITAAFTPNVESCIALCEAFSARGIKAEYVLGTTKAPERNAIYARLAAGVTSVMVNVMVGTEGWDCPPVSCVLVARPTKLPGLYQQIVGRGLRLSPETGKRDCLVLDVVGASRGQRLSTLVDLAPAAEYDTTELEALPCPECGGYTASQFAHTSVLFDANAQVCTCAREAAERGEGCGRCRRVACICLIGPATYEDFDLLAESTSLWLRTRAGIPFLPAGDRFGVLWPDTGNPKTSPTWSPGHVPSRGPLGGTPLDAGVPHTMDTGRQVVERWAQAYAPQYASRSAGWRRGKPSEEQIGKAYALGIHRPERFDKARLSDEISIAKASLRIDPK